MSAFASGDNPLQPFVDLRIIQENILNDLSITASRGWYFFHYGFFSIRDKGPLRSWAGQRSPAGFFCPGFSSLYTLRSRVVFRWSASGHYNMHGSPGPSSPVSSPRNSWIKSVCLPRLNSIVIARFVSHFQYLLSSYDREPVNNFHFVVTLYKIISKSILSICVFPGYCRKDFCWLVNSRIFRCHDTTPFCQQHANITWGIPAGTKNYQGAVVARV